MKSNVKRIIELSMKKNGAFWGTLKMPVYLFRYFLIWICEKIWGGSLDKDGFDKQYGTNTATMTDFFEPQYIVESKAFYQTLPSSILLTVLDNYKINFEDFHFIDIGCGKGKPLLIAGDYPFKKIVGIDIAAQLLEVAKDNINIYKKGQIDTSRFDLHHMSIEDYELPLDPLVIHLCNPVSIQLLDDFLTRLEQSLKENPREVRIIYVVPLFEHLFTKREWLKEIPTSTWDYNEYITLPVTS